MRNYYLKPNTRNLPACRGGVSSVTHSEDGYELEIGQNCKASPEMIAFCVLIDEITEHLNTNSSHISKLLYQQWRQTTARIKQSLEDEQQAKQDKSPRYDDPISRQIELIPSITFDRPTYQDGTLHDELDEQAILNVVKRILNEKAVEDSQLYNQLLDYPLTYNLRAIPDRKMNELGLYYVNIKHREGEAELKVWIVPQSESNKLGIDQ